MFRLLGRRVDFLGICQSRKLGLDSFQSIIAIRGQTIRSSSTSASDQNPSLRTPETQGESVGSTTLSGSESSDAVLDSYYESTLRNYFDNTKFEFRKDSHVDSLKSAMKYVYLRQHPLVSFDVEAFERNPKIVTEIGVSIYDPAALRGSIFPNIKTIHLIIKENMKFTNGTFVADNKHNFMGGRSYVMPLTRVKDFLNRLFQDYIKTKPGVLIGHGIEGDIKWLQLVNVEIDQNAPRVDTLKLHNISRSNAGNLLAALKMMNIPQAYLHNAGNDAYYTLLLALSYCDPLVRKKLELDVFKTNPKKSPADKRRIKTKSSTSTEKKEASDPEALFMEFKHSHNYSDQPQLPCN